MISGKHFTLFQIAAGACDTATGLLLLLSPRITLKLMGVNEIPTEPVLVSFIGAFVLSVGLCYLLFAQTPRSLPELAAARAAWLITGLQRLCVGCFVLIAVASKQMEPAWFSITIVDLSIAAFQLTGLRRKWLENML